jgi:hypothetical protein
MDIRSLFGQPTNDWSLPGGLTSSAIGSAAVVVLPAAVVAAILPGAVAAAIAVVIGLSARVVLAASAARDIGAR